MKIKRRYIYDRITRICHFGIASCVLLLFITAKLAKLFWDSSQIKYAFWQLHIFTGFILVGTFLLRFIWFFYGSKYSNFRSFLHFKDWIKIILNKNFKLLSWNWGHHPMASIAYIGLYLNLFFSIITGLFLSRIEYDLGLIAPKYYDQLMLLDPIISIHDWIALSIMIFVIIHIIALLWHEKNDGVPILESMKTGYQYKRKLTLKDNDEDS